MAKNIILDSGYWFAFYEKKDQYHEEALLISEYLHPHTLVIPWPSLYETLNTRFTRRKDWLSSFEAILTHENTVQISDEKYKDNAISLILLQKDNHKKYSLVDLVIREILLDVDVNINAIVTFNTSDFEDICWNKNIEIFNG
jgi:predicted nucleic acid-binding protein